MPVGGSYQKLPLIAPLRWLTRPLGEWLVADVWARVKEESETESEGGSEE